MLRRFALQPIAHARLNEKMPRLAASPTGPTGPNGCYHAFKKRAFECCRAHRWGHKCNKLLWTTFSKSIRTNIAFKGNRLKSAPPTTSARRLQILQILSRTNLPRPRISTQRVTLRFAPWANPDGFTSYLPYFKSSETALH